MAIPPFMELLALKKIGDNTYESITGAPRMGNVLPISYGGVVLAWA